MSRPISKLYTLKVSSTDSNLQREVARGEVSSTDSNLQREVARGELNKQSTDPQPTDTNEERPRKKAAEKAQSEISEWKREPCHPLEDFKK